MAGKPTYKQLLERIEHEKKKRERAEEALKSLDHKIKQYIAMAGVLFVALDREGKITQINRCGYETVGYRRQELLGKNWFKTCLPAKYQNNVLKVYHQLMKGEIEPIEYYENPILRKDGTERIIAWHNSILQDIEGNIIGTLSSGEDITERKYLENQIEQALEATETILENLPISIIIVGEDKKIRRVNQRALQETGFVSKKELIGQICHDTICPFKKGECPVTDFGLLLDRSEKTALRKDGRLIPILKTAIPMTLDGERVVLEAFMDITNFKLAEKALQEGKKKLQTIMETVADPIVVYDTTGFVTYLNPAFTTVFGWSYEELAGKRIDFVPDDAIPETQKAIQAVFNGKNLTGFETRRLSKSGQRIDVRIGAAMLRNESGMPNGMVVNFQDISLQKQTQGELLAAREKAEAANRIKSEFLANMSHEIRTPMNGVIGMTELLMETDLTSEQLDFAQTIQISGNALLSLINDILDYSKIEAGKFDLENIDFDLRVTLDSISDIVAVKAQEKGLEYITVIHPDVTSFLRGDPGRLRQILVNLVGNAVKFTQTGEIVVSVDVEKESENQITVKFTVKDTGIGIPEDKMCRLFKSFSQVDSSTTRKYGGTGLGLTISQKLAQMMGGKTGVASKEGVGSEFWFTVALEKQEAVPEPVLLTEDIKGKSILIVDDNKTNRFVLSEQLKSWGCLYDEAQDGLKAYEMLFDAAKGKKPFEIAIIDMQMPGMDGKQLGEKIKNTPETKNIRIVMMSSHGERGDSRELGKIGFDAYLTKPVKMKHLQACLIKVCNRKVKSEKTIPDNIITQYSLSEDERRGIRILLAEDNHINQKVALTMLNKIGYRADAVVNGMDAVAALKKTDYDLVLMDCQMPELDGYEATKKIRTPVPGIKNANVPIIAMTAHAMKGDLEKCLEAGMNDYLSKPVKPIDLSAMLNKWILKK